MIHNVTQKISKNELKLYSVSIERQSFDLLGYFNPDLSLPLSQHNHHLANDCVQNTLKSKLLCFQLQLSDIIDKTISFFRLKMYKQRQLIDEEDSRCNVFIPFLNAFQVSVLDYGCDLLLTSITSLQKLPLVL